MTWTRQSVPVPALWIVCLILVPCHPFLCVTPILHVPCALLSLMNLFDIAGVFDVQVRALLPGKLTWHVRRAVWPGVEIVFVVFNVGVLLLASHWIIVVLERPCTIPRASFPVKVLRAQFPDPGGIALHWKIDCVRGEHCKRGDCNCQLVHFVLSFWFYLW